MTNLARRAAPLALGGLLVAGGFLAGLATAHRAPGVAGLGDQGTFEVVAEARDRVRSAAERPVTDADLADGAVRGMLGALGDPYARY
jgi:hypothetical protein